MSLLLRVVTSVVNAMMVSLVMGTEDVEQATTVSMD